jgi:hypothetical protein
MGTDKTSARRMVTTGKGTLRQEPSEIDRQAISENELGSPVGRRTPKYAIPRTSFSGGGVFVAPAGELLAARAGCSVEQSRWRCVASTHLVFPIDHPSSVENAHSIECGSHVEGDSETRLLC